MPTIHWTILLAWPLAVMPLSAQGLTRVLATSASRQVVAAPRPAGLQASIAIDLDRVPLSQALERIARQGSVKITVTDGVNKVNKMVTLRSESIAVEDAFNAVLAGTGVRMMPTREGQVLFAKIATARKQGVVAGKVIDATTKQPVAGAVVQIEGTSRGTHTGPDGSFRFTDVPTGTQTISVRRLGYAKISRSVMVNEGGVASVDLMLEASANALDQVVVTGTVIATELKAVPNAITVVTAKDIEERGITQINQLFRGDVPGLFAPNMDSQKEVDQVEMWSRGAVKLGIGVGVRSNPIKTYVDGVEMADPQYLSQIDPKSIERIEILTGPQASTIYGSNAIHGVMQVFTKRGANARPQVALNLLSGWVESDNNSGARTPQHDYDMQISGVEGRLSYNAGGAWYYVGPWTPAKQTTRTGGFGGGRYQMTTGIGSVTSDLSIRRTMTVNTQRGATPDLWRKLNETGYFISRDGVQPDRELQLNQLNGQTLGFTLGYSPANWWSHEFGWGLDVSDKEQRGPKPGVRSPSDTSLFISQNHVDRKSLRYTTTLRVPVTSLAQATVTAGADGWQTVTSSMFNFSASTLTGSLAGSPSMSRQPDHNRGGFLQTQLGIMERVFLTYGVRAEWNPGFGENETPNYAPRYGIAVTQEVGPVTAKMRASYGRSTRPPAAGQKNRRSFVDAFGLTNSTNVLIFQAYGNFDYFQPNPDLLPERQQGGEGGLELYLGKLGSLVVTRYNQTVTDLIVNTVSDSVRSLVPNPLVGTRTCAEEQAAGNIFQESCFGPDAQGHYYRIVNRNENVGNIRNQGWEMQGTVTLGPFSGRGTYSWNKSRSLGVSSRFRATPIIQANPTNIKDFAKGSSFTYFPEHTWAAGLSYSIASTTIGLNLHGIGEIQPLESKFFTLHFARNSRIRLTNDIWRFSCSGVAGCEGILRDKAFATADLLAQHRFSSRFESVLQVLNVGDSYNADRYGIMGVMGRQVKAGVRVKIQ